MKLANIIYHDELINHKPLEYINYYCGDVKYVNIDLSLPTLYVGWKYMKETYSNDEIIQNADILEKEIILNKLMWEFSFKEDKQSHVSGVKKFVSNIPKYYYKNRYKYINLDPIFFQITDINDIMDILPITIDKVYKYKNDTIYTLKNNSITGINIKTYKFFNFNTDEILDRIKDRCDSDDDLYHDIDGDFYVKYYKMFHNYPQLKRYIVTNL